IVGAEREEINVPGVPVSPAAVRVGDFVFLSGMAGVGPDGKVVAKGDIKAQTAQALANVRATLAAAGAGPRDVIKNHTTIADWRHFSGYTELYAEFCGEPYPARASILGPLSDPDRLIEFDMIAVTGRDHLYVDTEIPGKYQTKAVRENVLLDPRLSP